MATDNELIFSADSDHIIDHLKDYAEVPIPEDRKHDIYREAFELHFTLYDDMREWAQHYYSDFWAQEMSKDIWEIIERYIDWELVVGDSHAEAVMLEFDVPNPSVLDTDYWKAGNRFRHWHAVCEDTEELSNWLREQAEDTQYEQ